MVKASKLYKKIINLGPIGFWPGFLAGLIYFGWIFWWFWSLYPLDIYGLDNKFIGAVMVFFVFLVSVLGTAVFWGGISLLITKLTKKRLSVYLKVLLPSSVFVLAEYARAYFFGILWFGSGAALGPHWTLGSPAYLLSGSNPLASTASFWGIYGVDFLILFFATSLILMLKGGRTNSKKGLRIFTLAVVIAIFLSFYLNINRNRKLNNQNKIAVSVIQTENITKDSYSSDEFLRDLNKKLGLLNDLFKKSPDNNFVVFPEGSGLLTSLSSFLSEDGIRSYLSHLSKNEVLVVDSNRIQAGDRFKSRTTIVSSRFGIVGIYDKKLLTMGGEYLPYLIKIPVSLFFSDLENEFAESRQFSKGEELGPIDIGSQQVKILACSDVISPSISRKNARGFMIATNSLGIFKGNKIIERQILSMSRMRAIENGKYLVLASNFGHSYIINGLGKVEKSTNSKGYQILTGDIVSNDDHTWYNKLGDWPILLFSLAVLSAFLMPRKLWHDDKN